MDWLTPPLTDNKEKMSNKSKIEHMIVDLKEMSARHSYNSTAYSEIESIVDKLRELSRDIRDED